MNTTHPTLYSLNSDGSVQEWTISVRGNTITRRYGRHGGKIQVTEDTVRSGKNTGRANATTPHQQALAEAQSAWEKKLKSGYVRSLRGAQSGETDSQFISGGVEPMLAHKWEGGRHAQFPSFVQPKLDGIRCLAVIQNGVCSLWSRTRKPIQSVPHIAEALEAWCRGAGLTRGQIVLDGELYSHDKREGFQEIVSLVRKEEPDPRAVEIQYHVYDGWCGGDQSEAYSTRFLGTICESHGLAATAKGKSPIRTVKTLPVDSGEAVIEAFNEFREQGYEGAIWRGDSGYENKRSRSLLKIKEFDDKEFTITGITLGRGRMSECAIFQCATPGGGEFRCKMRGTLDGLRAIAENPERFVGKPLTVRFQGYTDDGIPRFPVGVCVRDYE